METGVEHITPIRFIRIGLKFWSEVGSTSDRSRIPPSGRSRCGVAANSEITLGPNSVRAKLVRSRSDFAPTSKNLMFPNFMKFSKFIKKFQNFEISKNTSDPHQLRTEVAWAAKMRTGSGIRLRSDFGPHLRYAIPKSERIRSETFFSHWGGVRVRHSALPPKVNFDIRSEVASTSQLRIHFAETSQTRS